MKPIVGSMDMDMDMGMVWIAQFIKFKQRVASIVSKIKIVADEGKSRKKALPSAA